MIRGPGSERISARPNARRAPAFSFYPALPQKGDARRRNPRRGRSVAFLLVVRDRFQGAELNGIRPGSQRRGAGLKWASRGMGWRQQGTKWQ